MTRVWRFAPLAALLAAAVPVQADERLWANCRTCHAVTAPDGTVLARGGRSGPNLFALAGRPLAGDAGFRLYSDDLRAAGARGLAWTEADFIAYLADPDAFLQAATGQPGARSEMHVAMRQGGGALWAWLAGLQ
jgi:cytochrome c